MEHWRKVLNPDYLGAWDIPENKTLVLTIASFEQVEVIGSGNKKQKRNILRFKEKVKPLILNATNSKVIASMYRTSNMEHWVGKRIELEVQWVSAFGLETDAVRVKRTPPEKPTLEIGSEAYKKAVDYLKKGDGASIEKIENSYKVPANVKKQLEIDANAE